MVYQHWTSLLTSKPCQEGRKCAAIDIEYGGKAMDIMSPEGFSHSLFQVLRLRAGSHLFLAPVCSTWVWVSLGVFRTCFPYFQRTIYPKDSEVDHVRW